MVETVYKLTDANCYTRRGKPNETLWEIGRPAPKLSGSTLCSAGLYHAYQCPYIACFMDPIHGEYGPSARMWTCETPHIIAYDGPLKCGVHELTIITEIPKPKLTTDARIRTAIMLATAVRNNYDTWAVWANNWLSGNDRTKKSANAAYINVVSAAIAAGAATTADAAIAANAANAANAVDAASAAHAAACAAATYVNAAHVHSAYVNASRAAANTAAYTNDAHAVKKAGIYTQIFSSVIIAAIKAEEQKG